MAWLASETGSDVLASLTAYDDAVHDLAAAGDATALDPVRAVAAARKSLPGLDPALVSAALTQVRLRRRARPRLGDLSAHLLLTDEGLEQATRTVVADLRARRYAEAGTTHVADLGCGLGLDAMAFARVGLRVTAVERDLVTAALAEANVAALGLDHLVELRIGDVTDPATLEQSLARADAAYADPARRDPDRARDGRSTRQPDPSQWSPPWSWVERVASQVPRTAAKVAPGVPHGMTPAGGCATWTSVDGQLVEAELAWPALAQSGQRRRAVVVRRGTVTSMTAVDDLAQAGSPPVADVGQWLLEPDDAVIRAGLVADLAAQIDGWLLDPRVAYISTGTDLDAGDLAARFLVRRALPFRIDTLRSALIGEGIGHVVVKKRAIAVEPADVRRQLRLPPAPGRAVVLLTRVGADPWAFVCDPA